MYSLARKLLFLLNAEASHDLSLDMLGAAERLKLLSLFNAEMIDDPVEVMGLRFPNRVGLAAGLDKNGDYFNALGQMGFGFLEIGTVTPKPQPGNPEPRLFRLVEEEAIINRMGFNNKGVTHLVENVKRRRFKGVLGINIGKNKETPEENALSDYEVCMDAVYQYADYISVNVSSPNTPGLRNLQFGDAFDSLLIGVKAKQSSLTRRYNKKVPVAVKIAPDMNDDEIHQVADKLLQYKMDAVIATNTTIDRQSVQNSEYKNEMGGLSGAPLKDKSTQVISVLSETLGGTMPIIGVGGIMNAADAVEKIEAGASLIQVYSGFIYKGPALISDCAESIQRISPN